MARKLHCQRISDRRRLNRTSLYEALEPRLMLTATWRNPVDAMDVNADRFVSPLNSLAFCQAIR